MKAGMNLRRLLGAVRSAEAPTPSTSPFDPRWQPICWPDLAEFVPPRELWVGPGDPVVHFFRWSVEYRAYLVLLTGLRRSSSVLEIGCNHGRTMLALLDYLRAPGSYEGFDILPAQIEFAQRTIQTRAPQFRFTLADVHNGIYNPGGRFADDAYAFPYADARFDVAYAASVFTHLLPRGAANYLRQTARVLRPGGAALFSFFVLDGYRGRGTSACELYEFEHELPGESGVRVHDAQHPEAVIAYSTARIQALAGAAGLVVERVLPGYWNPSAEQVVNEQDLVLLRRP